MLTRKIMEVLPLLDHFQSGRHEKIMKREK